LDENFATIAREPVQDEIHVLPNRLANYGLVTRILADAKRTGASASPARRNIYSRSRREHR